MRKFVPEHRADGWNIWLSFARSPAPGDAPAATSRDQPLGAQLEAPPRSFEHDPGGGDLIIGAGRRRLDINNDGVLNIHQIVQPVTELHALVSLGGRGR
jgi:hypothetical protein